MGIPQTQELIINFDCRSVGIAQVIILRQRKLVYQHIQLFARLDYKKTD